MKIKNHFLIGSILLALTSFNFIPNSEPAPMLTRHDKDEAGFLKIAERFEKYICHLNLPDCEGTMIADQWAVSAAHCASVIVENLREGRKHFVIVNDVEIEVDKVIMYSEWENPQGELTSLNDIALLHLKKKPNDAMLARLYTDEDEVDKLIYMVGKGDKGNGLVGVNGNDGKQRGATNRVETATKKWLTWTFDHPDTQTKYLTEYEGISGPGDSGGPAFIVKDETVYIAGVSSWQDSKGGDEGLYGVVENYTRVSQYIEWIKDEMAGNGASEGMMRIEPKPDAIDYRPKAIAVDASTLRQYVGEYETQRVTIKIYTTKNDTKIYLFLDDQPPYEMVPTGKNKFTFKVSEEYKVEFKNFENGVFKEMIVTQPDGIHTATRKQQ